MVDLSIVTLNYQRVTFGFKMFQAEKHTPWSWSKGPLLQEQSGRDVGVLDSFLRKAPESGKPSGYVKIGY